jgi:hypothetical protein
MLTVPTAHRVWAAGVAATLAWVETTSPAGGFGRCRSSRSPTGDGTVEEIEADECLELGRHLTFVNQRILFVTIIYTEIVRRLDR